MRLHTVATIGSNTNRIAHRSAMYADSVPEKTLVASETMQSFAHAMKSPMVRTLQRYMSATATMHGVLLLLANPGTNQAIREIYIQYLYIYIYIYVFLHTVKEQLNCTQA